MDTPLIDTEKGRDSAGCILIGRGIGPPDAEVGPTTANFVGSRRNGGMSGVSCGSAGMPSSACGLAHTF